MSQKGLKKRLGFAEENPRDPVSRGKKQECQQFAALCIGTFQKYKKNFT
jgi:hypothetical protein